MHEVLDEDLGITLSHLEMEEKAAAFALETLMEKNGSLIQEIEQDLSTLDEALEQTATETNIMVTKINKKKQKNPFQSKNNSQDLCHFFLQSFLSAMELQDLEDMSRFSIIVVNK